MRRSFLLVPSVLVASAFLAVPASARAQTCGVHPGLSVAAAGGYVSHAVAEGTPGTSFGADMAVDVGPVIGQVGVRKMLLEGDAADPNVLRARASYPVLDVVGVEICGDGHAGVSQFSGHGSAGLVVAGGIGATATGAIGAFNPFFSVRGLAAWTAGTVLNAELRAAGLSGGVSVGVTTGLGPLGLRAAVALDGFDDGLGATPYPNTAIELAIGYRF